LKRAEREAAAWRDAGELAEVIPSSPEVKAAVRLWDKVSRLDDAREMLTFNGQQMTMTRYRLEFLFVA
jgi:hypothetical protein